MEQLLNHKTFFVDVKEASMILRAMNNQVRQNILLLLTRHGKLTVTEILIHLRLLQSITSQHLAILRRGGMVKTSREGKNIYYELNSTRLGEIEYFMQCLLR
jgi:DNA-binding transcriptional ArsR family regulator